VEAAHIMQTKSLTLLAKTHILQVHLRLRDLLLFRHNLCDPSVSFLHSNAIAIHAHICGIPHSSDGTTLTVL
jgi:hypothetical protein